MTIEELQKEIDHKGKLRHAQTVIDNFYTKFLETLGKEEAELTPFDRADLNGLKILLLSAANRIIKEPTDGKKADNTPSLPAA